MSALRTVFEAFGSGLSVAVQTNRSGVKAFDDAAQLADEMRKILGPGPRSYRLRLWSHEAFAEAAAIARRKPPTRPSWLLRYAPWARGWGLIKTRGKRRTRAWS